MCPTLQMPRTLPILQVSQIHRPHRKLAAPFPLKDNPSTPQLPIKSSVEVHLKAVRLTL